MNRRQFIATTAIGAAGVKLFAQGPQVITRSGVRPIVIASANGNRFKNGGPLTAVEKAFSMMTSGSDVLDSVIAGVNINELDPEDDSVGYGGLPNAEGVVQLDASCMHGPKRRAGAVAALEGIRTPSLVAKAVADLTDHHLIVGEGAKKFARSLGFKVEDDLNTENSRKEWLEWKRKIDPSHFPKPEDRERAMMEIRESRLAAKYHYGTIHCSGVNSKGEVCGVTTTSGLSWKIPGRVGDSPIFGAGLYVDGTVGAAGSTGRGEANLFNLSSYLIVENLRRGMHPKDAGMEAVKRIRANTVEKRLLNSKGNPNFYVHFYAVNVKGEYAGVSLYQAEKYRFAICTERGAQTLPLEGLIPGLPDD